MDNSPAQIGIIFEILLWAFMLGGLALSGYLAKKRDWYFAGFFFICVGCIAWGRFVAIYRLETVRFETSAVANEKIVLVADFHLRKTKNREWVERVVSRIEDEGATMVLIPGDFLTDDSVTYSEDFEPFGRLKIPVYYVLGNHDYRINGKMPLERPERLREALNRFGMIELQNQVIETENLILLGVEDNYLGYDDLPKLLRELPSSDKPKILLAHSPDIVDDPLTDQIAPDLIVSGHTHCGQIRMPLVGAVPGTIPTSNGRDYSKHYYPDKKIFVTCGVGESGPAARFLNPPEIVVIGDGVEK